MGLSVPMLQSCFTHMERAGRVLAKLKLAAHGVTDEQLACAAWAPAVGKIVANHTWAVALVRDRLVIEVEDAVWRSQLWMMRNQILARIEKVLGRKLATEIEFRIAVPRRQPGRADTIDASELPLTPSTRTKKATA